MWINLIKCASVEVPVWFPELDDAKPWVSPTVVKVNEAFLVKAGVRDTSWPGLEARGFDMHHSRSQLESMSNHVHIISLLGQNSVEPLVLLRAGLAVGDGMIAACAPWLEEPFLFSVSYDDAECTVRFWKEREGEEIMTTHLERFLMDGVLTARVRQGDCDENLDMARALSSIPRWVRRHLNQRQV